MATGILPAGTRPAASEQAFFAAYRWCLNPMLTLRELLRHLAAEVQRYRAGAAEAWQTEERRINLYLFTCAIACTLDDYLAARPYSLAFVARRFPRARTAARAAEALLHAPHAALSRSAMARAAAWRGQWSACVDAVCDLLLGGSEAPFLAAVRALLPAAPGALGEAALCRRMRIPEAFRCQDLTHHDAAAMLDLCLPLLPAPDQPVAMIGPRTAGAYFAPLAAARLRSLGYARVSWITVRPKDGLSASESRAIRQALAARARLLVIDDHPNSGNTLRLLLNALRALGAQSSQIVAVLPGHPAVPAWPLPDETARGGQFRLLPPADRYQARLLATAPAARALAAANAASAGCAPTPSPWRAGAPPPRPTPPSPPPTPPSPRATPMVSRSASSAYSPWEAAW